MIRGYDINPPMSNKNVVLAIGSLTVALSLFSVHLQAQEISDNDTTVYTVADRAAVPRNGINAFLKIVYHSIRYPENKNKSEGTTFVEMIIERDSTCTIIRTFKGPWGKQFDDEAIRVIQLASSMNKWVPAEKNGKVVRQRFILPVKFIRPEQPYKKKRF